MTVDIGNSLVTFRNSHMKIDYCYIGESDISYLETINHLVENPVDESSNKKILIPFNYLKPQRLYRLGQLWKSHFTNNFINKTIDIFISHRECVDYKLAFKLRHD